MLEANEKASDADRPARPTRAALDRTAEDKASRAREAGGARRVGEGTAAAGASRHDRSTHSPYPDGSLPLALGRRRRKEIPGLGHRIFGRNSRRSCSGSLCADEEQKVNVPTAPRIDEWPAAQGEWHSVLGNSDLAGPTGAAHNEAAVFAAGRIATSRAGRWAAQHLRPSYESKRRTSIAVGAKRKRVFIRAIRQPFSARRAVLSGRTPSKPHVRRQSRQALQISRRKPSRS